VTLTWTDSLSSFVTGYDILRKSGSQYGVIATVSSTAHSYTDGSAEGLHTTYTYEVEALSSRGDAVSAAVSATTPTLCL
jgi:hypothetical protein